MEAYVCVLSVDKYLDGVLVLNENLKRVKSKYPLLCVINENISENTKNILKFFGIQYQEIKSIDVEGIDKIINGKQNKKYLKYKLDKLNIFSLVKYKKLVYIDIDVLILENIDNLFDYPHIACPRDIPFDDKKYSTGIMVISPNLEDFENLKELVKKFRKSRKSPEEQKIINEYFKNINTIDYNYNIIRAIINSYCTSYDDISKKFEKKKRVYHYIIENEYKKVIHYIGKNKPFLMKQEYNDENYYLYRYYYNQVMKIKNFYNNLEQNDKVSVIVPIYNKERYLRECLNSIVNQIYRNIEILLIDDGSTDNSYQICLEYAKFDSRIRIIRQKNSGASSARNKGIEESSGKYIAFVDADDTICSDMIFRLMVYIKKYNLDFIQGGTLYNKQEALSCFEKEILAMSKKDVIREFVHNNVTCMVWDKIYKKELIENVRFDEKSVVNEDTIFTFDVVKNASSFGIIGIPFYNYMHKKEDCLTGKFVFEDNLNLLKYIQDVEKYIKENYPELLKTCSILILGKRKYLLRELEKLIDNGELDVNNKIYKELKQKVKR